jgi:hypothetical protein
MCPICGATCMFCSGCNHASPVFDAEAAYCAKKIWDAIGRNMNNKKQEQLFELCKKFIDDNDVYGGECVYQNDNVQLSACEFIEQICDIVGYKEYKEDE